MDVYEATSMDQFSLSAWSESLGCGGGGAQVMDVGGVRDPDPALRWCHGCGDWVEQVYEDDLCLLCTELDARLDAHVGAALEDYAEQAIGVALDYLHPDDVLVVMERILADRGGDRDAIPRLHDRFVRSHAFIDERARRARERVARRAAREGGGDAPGRPQGE
jgi:hypothetical protein